MSKVRGGSLLLDVRMPAEFEEIHIPGSVLHPLSDLDPAAVRKLAEGKNSCVVICRSGNRARQAAAKLESAGVPHLTILDGGILAWESAGLEVKRGRKTISLERQVRIGLEGNLCRCTGYHNIGKAVLQCAAEGLAK